MVYIVKSDCHCCGKVTKVTHINDYPYRRFLCDFCINGGGMDSSLIWGTMHYVDGKFVKSGTGLSLNELKNKN
tara:strand:- start:120 stop:338 length:219 start_codon:yes stop_codon:yes gene_type:complete